MGFIFINSNSLDNLPYLISTNVKENLSGRSYLLLLKDYGHDKKDALFL